ncbi:hypothetical protein, conserved, partial [Eimeria tenella]
RSGLTLLPRGRPACSRGNGSMLKISKCKGRFAGWSCFPGLMRAFSSTRRCGDPSRAELAKANAGVYGPVVASRLDFIIGDFATLTSRQLRRGALDVVFMSPPWGGPGYNARDVFDLSKMGGRIDFNHALRLAQRVAPRVAAFLPRSVSLLQLLRAAALFTLRSPTLGYSAGCPRGGFNGRARFPPAASAAAEDLPKACHGEAASASLHEAHRVQVELALCRSRREAGSCAFDALRTCNDLERLSAGLCKVVSRALPTEKWCFASAAREQEGEPYPKRRTIAVSKSEGQLHDKVLRPTAHERRWEASEAAEEEQRLFGIESELDACGSLQKLVAECRRVYTQIDDSPRDWRWLPVDLLWAATPLTKGFIRDPFHRLNRRLHAAREQQECLDSHKEAEEPSLETPPLLAELQTSPAPCVCHQIACWRWRAVGVTAFFGNFEKKEYDANEGGAVAINDPHCSGFPSCSHRPVSFHEQHGLLQDEGQRSLSEKKRLRKEVKFVFKALLQDALELAGMESPDSLLKTNMQHPASTPGVQREKASIQSGSTRSGPTSDQEDMGRDSNKNEDTTLPDEAAAQASAQLLASSIACFARQTFASLSYSSERLCNCFYSNADADQHGIQGKRQFLDGVSSTSEADSKNCSQASAEVAREELKAFADRLVSAATKRIVKARNALFSRRWSCMRKEDSGLVAEPCNGLRATRRWKSFLRNECEKVVHCYFAAASGCSATLRVALPQPVAKKGRKKKKRDSAPPVSAKPLPSPNRLDFLQRVANAYVASCLLPEIPQIVEKQEFFKPVPAQEHALEFSGGVSGNSCSGSKAVRDSDAEGGLPQWSPEEVLHWQFGCSMWCNSSLRVLVAQRLAPLLELSPPMGPQKNKDK